MDTFLAEATMPKFFWLPSEKNYSKRKDFAAKGREFSAF